MIPWLAWALDGMLMLMLLWLAWRTLVCDDLFKAVVLLIAFGLVLSLVWVRLDAPDVALAEAAIGAGLTGALLLSALSQLEASEARLRSSNRTGEVAAMKPAVVSARLRLSVSLLLLILFAALAWVVLGLPTDSVVGLRPAVIAQMGASGVEHPVTAVLLNFRGYDTLLELAVLLLAGLGVWSLAPAVPPATEVSGMMLDNLPRRLVPLMVLIAGYLLWRGASGPGGAFQAGAILGAAGVLLLLAGWRLPAHWQGWPLRLLLVSGVAVFAGVGLAVVPWSGLLLAYPVSAAGALILLVEAVATLAIGATLVALFLGGKPKEAP